MAMQLQTNMGAADRVIRGVLGSALFFNGLFHLGNSPLRKLEAGLGGIILWNGLSGIDPLLSALGATTIPGTEGNVLNRIKHAMPGPGIKPELTQYVIPQKSLKPFQAQQTVQKALSVG